MSVGRRSRSASQNTRCQHVAVSTQRVFLADLAIRLECRREHVHKVTKALGIEPKQLKASFSKGQRASAVTPEEAELICAEILRRRSRSARPTGGDTAPAGPEVGEFYAVVVDPVRPCRVKLGFSADLERRLNDFRIIAPDVRVLFAFPCRRTWELTAIAALTNLGGCTQVGTELYDVANTDVLFERAQTLFEFLPSPDA